MDPPVSAASNQSSMLSSQASLPRSGFSRYGGVHSGSGPNLLEGEVESGELPQGDRLGPVLAEHPVDQLEVAPDDLHVLLRHACQYPLRRFAASAGCRCARAIV